MYFFSYYSVSGRFAGLYLFKDQRQTDGTFRPKVIGIGMGTGDAEAHRAGQRVNQIRETYPCQC